MYCFRYDEAPLEQKPYREKDGALLAVGTLCDKLRQNEPYKSELENMLVQHVFPEFSSPAGHLRAKVLVTAFGCISPLFIRFCYTNHTSVHYHLCMCLKMVQISTIPGQLII